MTSLQPIALTNSWPLWERPKHFELGYVLSCVVTDIVQPDEIGALNVQHAGCWECDLSDDSLTWSGGVYDIFGLPRDAMISRQECVGYYREDSRAKMERLRAYAIKHQRGFTVDVENCSGSGRVPVDAFDRRPSLHRWQGCSIARTETHHLNMYRRTPGYGPRSLAIEAQ